MTELEPEINCSIFLKREWAIKELTRDINEVQAAFDKAKRAKQLKHEVEMLLSCEKYDEKNENCESCRFMSTLRKQTAELLLKAQGLGG